MSDKIVTNAIVTMNGFQVEIEKPDFDESIRMFVLLRKDLPYIHQSVQAGHAVAKYLIEHDRTAIFDANAHDRKNNSRYQPFMDELSEGKYQWNNGYMIYLHVQDELELIHWSWRLNSWGISNSVFEEPDWGTPVPVATSLACIGFPGDFKSLPLASLPKGLFSGTFKGNTNPPY